MAMLSTLRPSGDGEESHAAPSLWARQEASLSGCSHSSSPSVAAAFLMPPLAIIHTDLAVGSIPSEHPRIVEPDFGGSHDGNTQGNQGEPMDAEVVWFCSDCGDGPYGSWQNICQNCRHVKCGSCKEEKKK
ncbi:hypothetical protein K505DRAFT_63148 [Melanomma pulvis-pyrius CBS 109.77]|uniref:Uncharacterized protein n=1 Tax=Melanomma pulvis-pyrius CBS 109.77 TaxID=1314802 RepID=A0A6A6X6W9_9PLEO|nr:hypothetical protein K505DRAFT_63148 [Melanomma pulvis-pyrius CBS 109.77]